MSIKDYDTNLKLKDYLTQGEYKRSQIRLMTNNLEFVSNKISNGWSYFVKNKEFLLIAPEQWMVDLSDPFKATFYTNNLNINYAYFNFLKDKIQKQKLLKSNLFLSEGQALETEIRIIADNKEKAEFFARKIFNKFLTGPDYLKYLNEANVFLGKTKIIRIKDSATEKYPTKTKKLFLKIQKNYSWINFCKKDLSFPKTLIGLSDQIFETFKNVDVFIFIPWGCFKYIPSCVNEEMIDRLMFWETHFGNYNQSGHVFLEKNLKNKKIVIFDISYTGSTINKMSKMVKKRGGCPIRVALFPKSRLAVKNADYLVFLDRLIKASDVDTSSLTWFFDLYKKIAVND